MLKKFSLAGKFILASLLLSLMLVSICQAAFINQETKNQIGGNAGAAGAAGGYEINQSNQLLTLVQTGINAFLSLIGVILMVYILYSGYNWLTSHGEEEKVEKAKDSMKRAITGAIIIVAAYAISTFVIYRLQAGILSNSAGGAPNAQTTPGTNSNQNSLEGSPTNYQ